jgi:hypothetical protein
VQRKAAKIAFIAGSSSIPTMLIVGFVFKRISQRKSMMATAAGESSIAADRDRMRARAFHTLMEAYPAFAK